MLRGLLLSFAVQGAFGASPCDPIPSTSHVADVELSLYGAHEVSEAKAALCLSKTRKRDNYDEYLSHEYYEVSQGDLPFKDISQTGTYSFTSNADDTPVQDVKLGFTFPFFGHLHDSVLISPNGFLGFDIDPKCPGFGFCGWSETSYVRYIAPFMTDFDASANANSTIYFLTESGPDGGKLTVQWTDLYLWNSTMDGRPFTFQAAVKQSGEITFSYKSIPYFPNQVQNMAFGRKYPLTVGALDAVFLNNNGYYVLAPYKPLEVDLELVKDGSAVVLSPLPTCVQYTDCYSCLTKSEKETKMKCGWCKGARVCTDGIGREIEETFKACPSTGDLHFNSATCGNNPGVIAGAVLGSVAGVALLVGLGFWAHIRFRRYIRAIEGRMGGKKYDELPQLPAHGNPAAQAAPQAAPQNEVPLEQKAPAS